MYIATPEQPASYLFFTRTSHLNHTRPQNAPHTKYKFRVLLLNARTQPSFDQTDDGVDAETSLSFFLSLFMSTSLLRLFFFSRAHYWVNKYILKNACELQELFSTLKNITNEDVERPRGQAEMLSKVISCIFIDNFLVPLNARKFFPAVR